MNISKNQTACYDNLTTNNLTVNGHLKVKGVLTAKHIQGKGIIEAGEVSCDTLRAHTLRAAIATAQKIAVQKLFVQDCRATIAVVASDFAECLCMHTGKFTAAMFDIGDLKVDELVVLPPKKRGMLGTLFTAWLRTVFSRAPKEEKQKAKRRTSPKAAQPDRMDMLVDGVICELEKRGYLPNCLSPDDADCHTEEAAA